MRTNAGDRNEPGITPARRIQMFSRVLDAVESGSKENCRIVVVYEDNATRECVLRSAQQLGDAACGDLGLEIHWCPFSLLEEASSADDAANKAVNADVIIFAVAPGGDLPQEAKLWIEKWIGKRREREGALVGLVDRQSASDDLACLKEIYLRHVAHRAGMDYLSNVSLKLFKAIPDSLDSYSERAGHVTSVLDEILHASPRIHSGMH